MQNLLLVQWASRHPRLAVWIILATGMVMMLVYEARDVGLLPVQWLLLVIGTVLVAGICSWIVSWRPDKRKSKSKRD